MTRITGTKTQKHKKNEENFILIGILIGGKQSYTGNNEYISIEVFHVKCCYGQNSHFHGGLYQAKLIFQ
jgi:hypothetical protein